MSSCTVALRAMRRGCTTEGAKISIPQLQSQRTSGTRSNGNRQVAVLKAPMATRCSINSRLNRNRKQQQFTNLRRQELAALMHHKAFLEDHALTVTECRSPFFGTIKVIRAKKCKHALHGFMQSGDFRRSHIQVKPLQPATQETNGVLQTTLPFQQLLLGLGQLART